MIDRKPAPFVDLTPLRGASGKALDRYLATLSRNSRQQVRRALRLYQTAGPVRLEPARDVGEALSFLEAMAEPHQARWTALGRPGAFASSFFLRFHNTLIVEGFPRREVALFRVAAGSRPLGYLYCFTHRGTAYAYQNGFFYEADSRYKPGLVAHALAVERFAEDGFGRYDFLAGEAQYKRSLATGSRDLYWLAMQSRRPGLLIEAAVRKLWAATRGPLRQAARGRGRRSGHPGSVAP